MSYKAKRSSPFSKSSTDSPIAYSLLEQNSSNHNFLFPIPKPQPTEPQQDRYFAGRRLSLQIKSLHLRKYIIHPLSKMLFTAAIAATILAALPTQTAAYPSDISSLSTRDNSCQQWGSPGIVLVKQYSSTPGAGTCDHVPGVSKPTKGPLIRLPSLFMNGTWNCGRQVQVAYTPPVRDIYSTVMPAPGITWGYAWAARARSKFRMIFGQRSVPKIAIPPRVCMDRRSALQDIARRIRASTRVVMKGRK